MTTTSLNCKAIQSISPNAFWKSINILINKFHVVNKRLWGSKTLSTRSYKPLVTVWNLPSNCERLNNIENVEEYIRVLSETFQLQEYTDSEKELNNLTEVTLIELLPKAYGEDHAFQLIVMTKDNALVKFFDVTPKDLQQKLCPEFSYTLQLENDRILLNTECDTTSKSYVWLKDNVLPQFVKWASECYNEVGRQQNINESLALVSNDKYYKKYNELKLKYGKEMVKIWPECTDPSKFVYEDVAIATYLLVLWEDEKLDNNFKPQKFVDLGCGNGLLVYILTKEGHQGIGLDVRKRNIWEMYTSDVKLEEKTITPSDGHLFPDADWIIGNHSDELTPWIPVIASRSSYKCNFFILPCCAFNFDGSKYQRQNSSKSQYTEYLQYIKQLCEDCGYKTNTDRLKIPSTKRICLIGRGRIYPKEEHDKYCNNIQEIINDGISLVLENSNESWIKDFKPRDAVERVRNCTQIDKTLIESIVQSISNYLLEGCNVKSSWSAGKTVELSEVVQLISQDKLKALKSECGGLQTLLRNNHHIFKVQNGKVQLRLPKTVEEVNNGFKSNKRKAANMQIQQKPCWFYKNHPQGCPLSNSNCSFLHVQN